jgi:hypothetical protein
MSKSHKFSRSKEHHHNAHARHEFTLETDKVLIAGSEEAFWSRKKPYYIKLGHDWPSYDKYDIVVNGKFDGKIRDIEVGLITGDVTQANIILGSKSNFSTSSISQSSVVIVEGAVDLDFSFNGKFKGEIRDIEVGLITGNVLQINTVKLAGAQGFKSSNKLQTESAISQENTLLMSGNLDVDVVFNGKFDGKIRDVDIGLLTGDVVQMNSTIAVGPKAGSSKDGPPGATFVSQSNSLSVVGDVDLKIIFDGDFKGQLSGIDIGLITGDISQTNSVIEVGLDVSGGDKNIDIFRQFVTQTNSVDGNGDVDITLRIDADYRGNFSDIKISLIVDNIFQANTTVISATDAIWS